MKDDRASIRTNQDQSGFTLVELSLAMTFLAFIMLFVIVVIMQMINIYNKSISLSQINQAGRQLMSDLNGGARFASPSSKSVWPTTGVPNRMCIGGVSYVWNLADQTTHKPTMANQFGDGKSLSLIRVKDDNGSLCGGATLPASTDGKVAIIVGSNVLVQSLTVGQGGTGNGLLRVDVTLSTAGGNAPQLKDSGKPASASNLTCFYNNSSNNFCAFSEYNFVIYQRGATK